MPDNPSAGTGDLSPLPEAFVQLLRQLVPAGRLASVMESFAAVKPVCLRFNPLRAEPEVIRSELEAAGCRLSPVPWYPLACWVPAEQKALLTGSAAFAEGRIYLQSPSSMLAPLLLAPEPGEEVLDLAAAPGGKTLLLAAMMGNQGRIAAVEAVRGRFFRLKENLRRGAATLVDTYLADGRTIGRKVPGRFDRVLLDAPCSSEARFSRLRPESWAHWSARKVKETARKQQGLLVSALQALRPGGRLLYCTCAFSPEENELNVARLLRRFPGQFSVEPLAVPGEVPQMPGLTAWQGRQLPAELASTVRILPDRRYDGFYLALLRKNR
ncbi:16S rRNA (cytosine1407-C5)-methyltransferase [Geothermobacter ehrlichii]|uniref:16S rRNA (Cytosine1407-C5)-methyltransferase n=1 Tax=Geothermobacter ehrlichii TaxID=213224 RepID=A0A5D3WN13_9BACT|nr:RsmB/NOP family class I SAM-dependent RNA methyltransferase [Geothermobacter ehrlichii]TYO98715.1 16S rRNA (cytosine1407-C5)-methyltransferase [Geothermobacter ehrlichii]